jgi:transcriptional regulator GlxA family with amidase domain
MKPAAAGRILLWRGGSLWIGRALEATGCHAHHAVQISLSLVDGSVQFRRPTGPWTLYPAAIVVASQPHAFQAPGQDVAQVFVEPESRDGRSLQGRYGADGIAELAVATLSPQIAALAAAYRQRASDAELIALSCAVIAALTGSVAAPSPPPDPRVATAQRMIRERLNESLPLRTLAAAVHLSPDRFRHLFVEQTGVGIRPYLLWLRLERALGSYIAGTTLTEAAHTGGFADSAHFSRTFKRMFGMAPASVRTE